MKNIQKNQKGMASLFLVIVVGVVGFLMASSSSFLGLGDLEMSYVSEEGGEAFAFAESCADEAFERLRLDPSFSSGALNDNGKSCIIGVGALGDIRTIYVTSTYKQFIKKIKTEVDISGPIIDVLTWEEY